MRNKVLSSRKRFLLRHPEVLMTHFMAYSQAICEFADKERTLDWHILAILHEQKAPVSFHAIYKVFNKGNPGHSNQRYYNAFFRLTDLGYISMEYNKRGWRMWTITPEGRLAIQKLNEAALKYLPD